MIITFYLCEYPINAMSKTINLLCTDDKVKYININQKDIINI